MANEMVRRHVTLDSTGFVTGWCNEGEATEGSIEITTPENLLGNLDAIKVVDGLAQLDNAKQKAAEDEANAPDPRDAAILELTDLVISMMEGGGSE
ncbi:hypothetical protein HCA69_12510 [Listeria grandensis]|uniref:Uncharacterized protein n=1 Tax=Listeria grandensis TaxID=1494963 RepID=A0A7X1CQM4_9LIST|nr:hypothetical protein [Listeria grandensis]MBC1937195.1 hypothetical protein [Listeria grandensis]